MTFDEFIKVMRKYRTKDNKDDEVVIKCDCGKFINIQKIWTEPLIDVDENEKKRP